MGKSKVPVGIVLLAVLVFLLLGKLGVIGFLLRLLWPAILLGAGLYLHRLYFRGRGPAVLLLPGGILVTYAAVFLICLVFGWRALLVLWPGFLFGIAVGLYEWATFGRGATYGLPWVYPAAITLAIFSCALFLLTLIGSNLVFFSFVLLAAVITFLAFQWKGR